MKTDEQISRVQAADVLHPQPQTIKRRYRPNEIDEQREFGIEKDRYHTDLG